MKPDNARAERAAPLPADAPGLFRRKARASEEEPRGARGALHLSATRFKFNSADPRAGREKIYVIGRLSGQKREFGFFKASGFGDDEEFGREKVIAKY